MTIKYVNGETQARDVENEFTNNSGSTISAGKICQINSSGELSLADASDESTTRGMLVVPESDIANGASGTCMALGFLDGYTGLTAGADVWLSETAGEITHTPPTGGAYDRLLGYAISTTEIFFFPSNDYAVTAV